MSADPVTVFVPKLLYCQKCRSRIRALDDISASPSYIGASPLRIDENFSSVSSSSSSPAPALDSDGLPRVFSGQQGTLPVELATHVPPHKVMPASPYTPRVFLGDDVINAIHSLRAEHPGFSIDGLQRFLQMQYRNNRDQSVRLHDIANSASLANAYSEANHLRIMLETLRGQQPRDSPASGAHEGKHPVVHFDACFALYVFKSAKDEQAGLDGGQLWTSTEDVDAHANSLKLQVVSPESKKADADAAARIDCSSDFLAARGGSAGKKGGPSLSVTGQAAVVDRHGVITSTGPLLKGEAYKYASAYFMHGGRLRGMFPLALFYDIICRWWPWAKARLDAAIAAGGKDVVIDLDHPVCSCCEPDTGAVKATVAAEMESAHKCLNTAHSYGHDVPCQGKWAAFLNFCEQIGWTTGEEGEQVWSRFKLNANSTKHMGLGRRTDLLLEWVRAWNVGKQEAAARQLIERLRDGLDRVTAREALLTKAIGDASQILGIPVEKVESDSVVWRDELLGHSHQQWQQQPGGALVLDVHELPKSIRTQLQTLLQLQAAQAFGLHFMRGFDTMMSDLHVPTAVAIGALPKHVSSWWCGAQR